MAKLPDITAMGGRPSPQPVYATTPYNEAALAPSRELGKIGGQLVQLGETFGRIHQQEQHKQAMTRSEDDHNKIKTWMLDNTYGEKGYQNTIKGADALNEDWINNDLKRFDEHTEELKNKAGNGEHKERLSQIINAERLNYLSNATKHKATETEKYKREVVQATIDTSEANAVAGYDNNNTILSERVRIKSTLDASLDDAGVEDKTVRDSRTKKVMSDYYLNIMNKALLENNPRRAEEIYNMVITEPDGTVTKVSDEIDAKKAAPTLRAIKKGSELNQAQSITEEWIDAGKSPEDMYKLARDKHQGDLQEGIERQIDKYVSREKGASRLIQKNAQERAYKIYRETGDVEEIPPNTIIAMGEVNYERLVRIDAAKKRAAASGTQIQNDPMHYAEVMEIAMNKPGEFMQMVKSGELQSNYQLNGKTIEKFIGLASGKRDLVETKSMRDYSNAALTEMGIKDPNKARFKKNTDGQKVRDFDMRVSEWAMDEKEKLGVWPSAVQYKEFIAGQKLKIAKKGWVFDGEQAVGVTKIEGVPANMVAPIAQHIEKRKGSKATVEEIQELWKRHQLKGTQK